MQDWIHDERELILHFLRYWKARAEDATVAKRKEEHEEALEDEWKKWELETDVETGEIFDEGRRNEMLKSMGAVYAKRDGVSLGTAAYTNHENYLIAQGLWEGKFVSCHGPLCF
jgi:hypothetical protein